MNRQILNIDYHVDIKICVKAVAKNYLQKFIKGVHSVDFDLGKRKTQMRYDHQVDRLEIMELFPHLLEDRHKVARQMMLFKIKIILGILIHR